MNDLNLMWSILKILLICYIIINVLSLILQIIILFNERKKTMNLKKQREKYFLKQTKKIKKIIGKKIKDKYCNGEQYFTVYWAKDSNNIIHLETKNSEILFINVEKARIIIDEYLKRNKIKYIVSSQTEPFFNCLVYEFVEDNNDL